jgi:hypothetical protein
VTIKPYRLPPLMDAELNRQVFKLCQTGKMQPTTSPYSSPIFLVRKPARNAGKCRKRKLFSRCNGLQNSQIKDIRSLPRITKGRRLHAQNWSIKNDLYAIFDNKEAFYCLPLAEESKDLIAVSTSKLYARYTRMPLGIKVASALYHLELSNLLRTQLNSDLVILYQDDLFLFTDTWEQHKELMKQIFQRYHFANIRFSGKKTQLCAE